MERGSFGTKIGVVLATAGSAVGLGNIWRFPYMTGQDGGAAFIIIYLLCIVLLGVPGMVAEFIVGRHGSANAARSYARAGGGGAWAIVGTIGALTSLIILGFYSVIAGWCLQYLYASIMGNINGDAAYVQEYFNKFTSSPIEPIVWTVAFITMTHLVVVRGVRRGIEKVSNVLMPTLFVLLVVIVVASCSLNFSLGQVLLAIDLCIIGSCMFFPQFGDTISRVHKVMFGLCTMVVENFMLDHVMNVRRESVQFMIFSKKSQEIADAIGTQLDRGVTILDGHGWYTGQEMKVLCILARKRESTPIFRLIKMIDPNAFVSQSSALGVLHGDGCDGRTGINAQGRHRLDVCLNAGSSATVGSGNSQCCIVFHIFFIFILFILDLLIYL